MSHKVQPQWKRPRMVLIRCGNHTWKATRDNKLSIETCGKRVHRWGAPIVETLVFATHLSGASVSVNWLMTSYEKSGQLSY